jgi:hypothetical protein
MSGSMFSRAEPRFSREAILTAMTAAGLVKPLAQICRARDNTVNYDLVAGPPNDRRRERVPVSADEDEFMAAIDKLVQAFNA